jgi:hypothetical protein
MMYWHTDDVTDDSALAAAHAAMSTPADTEPDPTASPAWANRWRLPLLASKDTLPAHEPNLHERLVRRGLR